MNLAVAISLSLLAAEPEGVQFFDGTWKAAILQLHRALSQSGLAGRVGIVGTDGPGDFNHWIEQTARDQLADALAADPVRLDRRSGR